MSIPFNRPHSTGKELDYIREALANMHVSGDGPFTKRVNTWLAQHHGCASALMTHSGTAALEMMALLCDIEPGDEVIMPSFTFVSTANAFVLRGGVPVFVDMREDTLNIDERLVEQAITARTRAIIAVHYAGVACEMDALASIAQRRNLLLLEDAAQGIGSLYKGKPLGSFGALGALSFHETKNLISGEGGALLVNDQQFSERAEIIREKGTNRAKFFRGQVDKYTWVDVGSSYLPSDILAAFLWAQLQCANDIIAERIFLWQTYHGLLAPLEAKGLLRRPIIPENVVHNGHIYYVLLSSEDLRNRMLDELRRRGVGAVFHYVPLHSSPAGKTYARTAGSLEHTDDLSARLLRLPLYPGMRPNLIEKVCETLADALAVA